MRFSRKAQYACIAMLELASKYESPQPVRVKAIAEAHGIPQRFLVQILLQMKTAGLVGSVRGASGGYQLARPPDQISLSDVIGAVDDQGQEKPPALVGSPGSPAAQAIAAAYQQIQVQEQRLLEELTLAELVRRSQEGADLSYQI
jgi:Rrf2 family protein